MTIKLYTIGKNEIAALHLVTFGRGRDATGPHYHLAAYVAGKAIHRTINFTSFYQLTSRTKNRLRRLIMALNPLPIYYMVDSRDCVHYRVTYAERASNGWRYLKACDSEYKLAEGPTYVYRITKADYRNHQTTQRDYIAEAHENGHPYSVDY